MTAHRRCNSFLAQVRMDRPCQPCSPTPELCTEAVFIYTGENWGPEKCNAWPHSFTAPLRQSWNFSLDLLSLAFLDFFFPHLLIQGHLYQLVAESPLKSHLSLKCTKYTLTSRPVLWEGQTQMHIFQNPWQCIAICRGFPSFFSCVQLNNQLFQVL